MKFRKEVQDLFKKAGWFQGRNIESSYDPEIFKNYPQFLKDFLSEYGSLTVLDCKNYESNIRNQLEISPENIFVLTEGDDSYDYIYDLLKKDLYVFSYFNFDSYYIACDEDANLYMIGDHCFLRANSLETGIEKLLLDDWLESKQLNEETGYFE